MELFIEKTGKIFLKGSKTFKYGIENWILVIWIIFVIIYYEWNKKNGHKQLIGEFNYLFLSL